MLFSLVESFIPLLRPDLNAKDGNTQQWPEAVNYEKNLREMGMSEEAIQKEMLKIRGEQPEAKESEGDTFELVKGPNGT